MTTTSHYQNKPDYYDTIEQCNTNKYMKSQTNPRYKNFTQTHFTCGDEEQFLTHKYQVYHDDNSIVENDSNIFNKYDCEIWEKYHNLDAIDVIHTFHYMFYKFKKGIFIKILNNELKVFLPFSNAQFVNEWSHKINLQSMDIFKYIAEKDNYVFQEHKINKYKETWFANNGLIRYEYPHNEGDTNVSNIKNMFEELCANRKLPDIELFINRRDFPILNSNGFEPYDDLWDGDNIPLVSHKYDKYVPILSMNKTDKFADILIPTHEDWSRIQSEENKFFINSNRSCDNLKKNIIDFDSKKPIAVFRGSSTGDGFTIETNQRLKVAYLSSLNKLDNDNLPFLDAGITKWNMRAKKKKNISTLQCLKIEDLPFSLVPFLTYNEQCQFKYIIHIDGHVCAFRLSQELSMNSVILLVQSKYKIWYSDLLKPFEHYVPIKEDLSDLFDKIQWCKANDLKCKEIAKNAVMFFNTFLCKNGVLDFLQNTLIKLKQKIGSYSYPKYNISHIIKERQLTLIQNYQKKYPQLSIKTSQSETIPYISRCYGLLKAIQLMFFKNNNHLNFSTEGVIFKNKNVTITKNKIDEFYFISKKLAIPEKDHTHECFVGLFAINKILKFIPNFVYTFGINDKNDLLLEYNNGMKFYDYLNSDKFNFDEYLSILMQLCLCLHFAQQTFLFVHNDLTSWNIMLNFYDKPINIDYIIDSNKIITVYTKCVPTIIDYGKSHVAYKNIHYGNVNALKFSSIQDMISILVTSMYHVITTCKLNKNEYTNLIILSNFMSNSQYCNYATFRNAKQLKTFLSHAKKHSNLIHSNKYNLEEKTPMDIFTYINNRIPSHTLKFKEKKTCFISYMNNKHYAKQIYYKILSQKDDLESFKFYINKFRNYTKQNNFQSFYKVKKYIHYLSMFKNVIDCKEVLSKMNTNFYPKNQEIKRIQIEWNELMFLSNKLVENTFLLIKNLPSYECSHRIKRLFFETNFDFDLKNEVFIVNVETFCFLHNFLKNN